MKSSRHNTTREHARNIFLIILAVAVVYIFFNLDFLRQGDSVFSKSAANKLSFSGKLKQKAYTDSEVQRLLKFIERYDEHINKMVVQVSPQDDYKRSAPSSPMLFEIQVYMDDDSNISTPVRRATRKELVSAILFKLDKDMRAYISLKEKGKKMKSLVNTM